MPTTTTAGIYNQGNSCFLNALLQTIASSPKLGKYFCDLGDLLDQELVYSGTCLGRPAPLSQQIGSALALLQTSKTTLNLAGLQSRVQLLFPTQQSFVGDDQQDADEVLLLILDAIEKESKAAWRTLAPKLNSAANGLSLVLDPWWGEGRPTSPAPTSRMSSSSRAPLASPLLGSLFLLLQCTRCGRKSPLKPDPFSVLGVQLVGPTLDECLRDFCKREEIEGYYCEHCKQKTRAVKREVIGKLPLVLCVKILRNLYVNGRMVKNRNVVALPDVLDLKPACFFHVLSEATTAGTKTTSPPSPWKQSSSSSSSCGPVTSHVLGVLDGNLAPAPPKLGQQEHNTEYRLMAVVG
ncbi:hypothetical protein BASA81_007968 [Batrachochytrium salamandrivorans]|nr:hypothetical protein BASA81_007968 [Batrachochytrium salamandrivorans]